MERISTIPGLVVNKKCFRRHTGSLSPVWELFYIALSVSVKPPFKFKVWSKSALMPVPDLY